MSPRCASFQVVLTYAVLVASMVTSAAAQGIFNQSPQQVDRLLGKPFVLMDKNKKELFRLYCVTGKYHMVYWDNSETAIEPGWVKEPNLSEFPSYGVGKCGKGENVYVRFQNNKAVIAAVGTGFSAFRDEGWRWYLSNKLAGVRENEAFTLKAVRDLKPTSLIEEGSYNLWKNRAGYGTLVLREDTTRYLHFWFAPGFTPTSTDPLFIALAPVAVR